MELTEERIRQIFREELKSYFDNRKPVDFQVEGTKLAGVIQSTEYNHQVGAPGDYEHKDSILWNGSNLEDIKAFLGDRFLNIESNNPLKQEVKVVFITFNGIKTWANEGEIIKKDPEGTPYISCDAI